MNIEQEDFATPKWTSVRIAAQHDRVDRGRANLTVAPELDKRQAIRDHRLEWLVGVDNSVRPRWEAVLELCLDGMVRCSHEVRTIRTNFDARQPVCILDAKEQKACCRRAGFGEEDVKNLDMTDTVHYEIIAGSKSAS